MRKKKPKWKAFHPEFVFAPEWKYLVSVAQEAREESADTIKSIA